MMKRSIVAFFSFVVIAMSASAMSYEQARHEALYLTDKMAYELNLSAEQMEAVYEINLDYLLYVNRSRDLYDQYWDRRNVDLSYVLSPYQYQLFLATNYFYRPLNWVRGAWSLAIYGRYADRHLFYYSIPRAWRTYRGGHNVGVSIYKGRNFYAPSHNARPSAGHAPAPFGSRRGGMVNGNNHRMDQGVPSHGNRPGGYEPNGNNRPSQGMQPNSGQRPSGMGNNYQNRPTTTSPNSGQRPSGMGNPPQNNRPTTTSPNNGQRPSQGNQPRRSFGGSSRR